MCSETVGELAILMTYWDRLETYHHSSRVGRTSSMESSSLMSTSSAPHYTACHLSPAKLTSTQYTPWKTWPKKSWKLRLSVLLIDPMHF